MRQKLPKGGFSLFAGLILLGITGIIVFALVRSYSAEPKVQDLVEAKRGAQDDRQLIDAELIQVFRSNPCFDPASAFSSVAVASLGSLNYSTAVLTGVNLSEIQSASMAPRLTEAQRRCTMPRPPNSATGIAANAHRYFCLELTPGGASSLPGSLFSRAGGFAEVYVESRDFNTGQPVDCATVAGDNQGAAIIYTLYWPALTANGPVWQALNGSLNAAFH